MDGKRIEDPARVVIVGGGVAALEGLLALRQLAHLRVTIELLAPNREFCPQPLSVAEPFGLATPRPIDLGGFATEHGAHLHRGALAEVDVAERLVRTGRGETLAFDALLLAVGATSEAAVPGALTFRGRRDTEAFRDLLGEIEGGSVNSIAFAVPAAASWSLPLYELALMTAAHAAALDLDLRINFVTHEREPLAVFGVRVFERARALLTDAGIRLWTGSAPLAAHGGRLLVTGGAEITADRVVALGRLSVPPIPGVPQGASGFIPTDAHCRVEDAPRVYAAGDATWFPVKQGGIAAQQADSAASAIAADLGLPVAPQAFAPVLRGVLLTGGAPQYLRSDVDGRDDASEIPLWLPAAKIAGRLLGPYLVDRDELTSERLTDRTARALSRDDHQAALDLALDAADAAAAWDDHEDALRWLRVAEGLNVALPLAYARKRREWSARLEGSTSEPVRS